MKEGWQRLRFVIASIVGGKEAKGKLLDLPVPFSLKLAYEEKTKEGAKLLEEKAERHLSSDTSSLPAQVAIIKLFSHRLSGHCPNPWEWHPLESTPGWFWVVGRLFWIQLAVFHLKA